MCFTEYIHDNNTPNRGFIVYREATDVSGKLPASTLFFNDNTGINNTLYTYYVSALNMGAACTQITPSWTHRMK
ncbi:MAG: hypothetical protein A2Y62_02095 [Candidatus Fischerbacteria bacterium RBG_13_37_8]|uniref:Uncharacterized protein n=1 Tax=Candidatus Fischerbacteria bacterium RBG_13_37_8 TaxID=1817863 RepID=A0A1F5VJL9_9BACT|nr:MAG: hypothetical protein A2Y62_02095 [Candidatus Fischerbacteria bacterium RBG_13_37_8]